METPGLCEFLYIFGDWCHTFVRFGAIGITALLLLVAGVLVIFLLIVLATRLNP